MNCVILIIGDTMKKNGYTLVEVLAVIIILGLLTAVIIPTVDAILESNKEKAYQIQIDLLLDGLENWGASNAFSLPTEEGETLVKKVGELKQDGFLDNELVNPKNSKCISNELELIITRKNNKYIYSVKDNELIDGPDSDCK